MKGASQIGKTIKVNFIGKNIPNLCLFSDTIDGQAIGGGHGVYLCTSFQQVSETPPLGAPANQHKLMPYAPYRWSPSNKFAYDKMAFDDLTHFRYNDIGNAMQNKGLGYLDAVDGVNYEYDVKVNSYTGGNMNITVSITNVDTSTLMFTNTFTLDLLSHVSLGENVGLGSDLIFYGQGAAIDFTYTIE